MIVCVSLFVIEERGAQNLTLRSVESSVIEFSEQGERPSDP